MRKNLYYRLYYGAFLNGKKSSRTEQSDKSAAVIGMFLLTAMLFVNFLTAVIFLNIIGLNVIWNFFHENSWILYLVIIGIVLINYNFFLKGDRYRSLIKLYKDETKRQCNFTITLWLLYIITTGALLFIALDNNMIV